ncbi:DUF58 domain-containing protein [Massilia sp. P8910]|uniref:DUF58 domain-containing protein n=1 Tax=Massilia antarctica TaxID=2765360 RepID=UPI001E546429|nr:DUF58 domain-containing protein [Massilia antarctica]MCE3608385.1 DUF58 domain-containing protein [Massilia antarctica]
MLSTSALLAHTNDLNLIIRHVLAGLGHGIHAGRERGAGVEFSEYRAYAPGDEWRRVDWKLLARADRYYVREAERDSHVAVWLWLDATASMAEPSRSGVAGLDKLWYARTILACIAAIAQRQGDAFGLVVCSGERVQFTPAARGPRQMQRVLAQLKRVEAGGALPDSDTLRASMPFVRAPSLVFAASDFLDWPSGQAEALLRLRRMRHDVRLLCLQTRAECDASFPPETTYRDPENPDGVFRFAADTVGVYRKNRDEHFARMLAQCRRNDIAALAACIEEPLPAVLRAWLRQGGRA